MSFEITPSPIQAFPSPLVQDNLSTPVGYHNHDGINSPLIDSANLPATSSGTPAGADTEVQFNDNGAFGGDDHFLWDKTLQALILKG